MTITKTRLTGPMSLRLRDARITAGMSRRELAEVVGMSERAVNYYEDRNYSRARKSSLVNLWAQATGRTFEELWGAASEQPILRTGWSRRTAA